MKNNHLVSVIITTANRASLLSRAIDSVLNQTYKNFEIIIANDASTDNTESIIKNYQDKYNNIKHIKHKKPMGANVGRNNAIQASLGDFIAGLDDDDEFTPDRLETLLNHYDPKYSMCTTKNIIKLSYFRKRYQKGKEIISLEDMLYQNDVGNQVLVEKTRLYDVGLYDKELTACQDYDMWIRLIKKFGPAKSINKYTQIIHANHNQNRISNPNSRKKFIGYFRFYKKYKRLMSREQRKSQLFIIYKNSNKIMSFNTCRLLCTNKIARQCFILLTKQIFNTFTLGKGRG